MKKKITPQFVLIRLLKGISILFIGGLIHFSIINWINSGKWGIGSLIILVSLTLISSIGMSLENDKDETDPTWSSIGKGLLIGFLIYIILSIIAVYFGWPYWSMILITGFSTFLITSVATDKDVTNNK